MTRLHRFRAYMARMNPVRDPAGAIAEGLHVQRSGTTVAEQVALHLELEPASMHLILGGIGSGKTTELLGALTQLQETFSETGDHVEYIDVSRLHDLGGEKIVGVLAALAGLSLANLAPGGRIGASTKSDPITLAARAIRRHARGYWEHDDDRPPWEELEEDFNPDFHRIEGVLASPERPIPDHLEELVPHLQVLRRARGTSESHAVFLFDSLDRLPSTERFRDAVQDDLRALKAAGIGAAVVGPIRFMVGNDRSIADLFDQTHFLFSADPRVPQEMDFLRAVLRRRADPDILPDPCLEPIARASGGVLRDLISIAKGAGINAHSAGHEAITPEDVQRAIDSLARDLAVGLDDEQVKKLRHLASGAGFVIRGERELVLLETRRVLFYGGSSWAVHPALAPLLGAVPEAA